MAELGQYINLKGWAGKPVRLLGGSRWLVRRKIPHPVT
jgi:hypothetical protein